MRVRVVLASLLAAGVLPAAAIEPVARIVVQRSPLAGVRYYDGPALWADMRPGDTLALRREPENPHDPNAIRVEWRGRMLGYVPRTENAALARQIDLGARAHARIIEIHRHGNGRRRLSYEILVPLTAPAAAGREQ